MDCLQLQLQPHQLRTQPFHYLINEQAKSLLALQELQNEVGALLEFRDLVMETFPNLRQKMSGSNSHNFSNTQNYCSNLPLPLSGSLNSRHWEPGIKVKRKIVNKSENENSYVRVRSNSHSNKIQSSQPKSSEAISGVQDSGFSTETNSSNKDHVSSTATSVPLPVQSDDPFLTRKESNSHKDSRRSEYDRSDEELSEDGLVVKVNEAEEELWNLLDVIHTKGTKLREEVETLQLRLMVEEIENHLKDKELERRKIGKKFNRRCRSLDNVGGDSMGSIGFDFSEPDAFQPHFKFQDLSSEDYVFSKKRTRSIELEDVDHIRQERNMLLDKLAQMETENLANRIKTSELQNEISALTSTKEELQEQLFQAVKQKTELNSRIHELHMKFVTRDKKWKNGSGKSEKTVSKDLTDSESSQSEISSLGGSKSSDGINKTMGGSKKNSIDFENFPGKVSLTKNLDWDGLVITKETRKSFQLSDSSKKKLAEILKEKNYLELQRHLLIAVVQNQILTGQLEISTKSKEELYEQLDRYRKENDELLFQLEEKNIELEGTRAQVRVLEKIQHQSRNPSFETKSDSSKTRENFTFLENNHLRSKGFSESEINRARQIFLESENKKVDRSEVVKFLNRTKNASPQRLNDLNGSFDLDKSNNVIPILALPLPVMTSHHSSGTESTQALEISSELEAEMAREEKSESLKNDKSPYKRKPSKIPLNISKNSKSAKSGLAECPAYLKKSDVELNRSKDFNNVSSLKKCSLENSQSSISCRSPSQNPTSMKYNSVGRTGSQLSIASQKSHASALRPEKRKSLTNPQKEEGSLTSGKNISLKQMTNFSNIRQRDTLSRKTQNDSWENSGKRTIRSSLRESFRNKISIDGNGGSSKKDGSLSVVGKKDSLQLKQNRSNPVQQKTNLNKSILSPEGDNTKLEEDSSIQVIQSLNGSCEGDELEENIGDFNGQSRLSFSTSSIKQDSDIFLDSLNSLRKQFAQPEEKNINLLKEVRQNFQRRLAEKFSQTFSVSNLHAKSNVFGNELKDSEKNVWNRPKSGGDYNGDESIEANASNGNRSTVNFFDSIDDGFLSPNKDDSLLINSSNYRNKSVRMEATNELDSLEVKPN